MGGCHQHFYAITEPSSDIVDYNLAIKCKNVVGHSGDMEFNKNFIVLKEKKKLLVETSCSTSDSYFINSRKPFPKGIFKRYIIVGAEDTYENCPDSFIVPPEIKVVASELNGFKVKNGFGW